MIPRFAQLPLGSNSQYAARVRERCTDPAQDGAGDLAVGSARIWVSQQRLRKSSELGKGGVYGLVNLLGSQLFSGFHPENGYRNGFVPPREMGPCFYQRHRAADVWLLLRIPFWDCPQRKPIGHHPCWRFVSKKDPARSVEGATQGGPRKSWGYTPHYPCHLS